MFGVNVRLPLTLMLTVALGVILVHSPAHADDVDAVPVRIDPSLIGGRGLDKFAPWPAQIVKSGGDPEHKLTEVFSGEFVTGIYQSKATKLAVKNPWPFDEYLMILSGELHLTDATGTTQIFPTGSNLVVPRGFTGVWEMKGDLYRELYIIETAAYAKSQEPGGLLGE